MPCMRREMGRFMGPALPVAGAHPQDGSAARRPRRVSRRGHGQHPRMDPEQQQRFREAVDRKSREAEQASRATQQEPAERPEIKGDQENLYATGETQDTFSVRDKNSGKGQK